MKYVINERIIAKDGQQDVKIRTPFNEKQINVFLNGRLMNNGLDQDYVQTDEYTIKFNSPLNIGDIIAITSLYTSSNNISLNVVNMNKYTHNGIFNLYGQTAKLKTNQKYSVNINIKGFNISWDFVSKVYPLLSNIKNVRRDTGEVLIGYSDKDIMETLYENTKDVLQQYKDVATADTGSISTVDISDLSKVPLYLTNWVRYKTDLDLCNAVYMTLCSRYGKVEKVDGPIDITQEIKIPRLDNMLKNLQKKFDQADKLLNKEEIASDYFVKANSTTYPLNKRVKF